MQRRIGNSGAPRWYEMDLERFPEYIDHIHNSGATAGEIVLHHGHASDFTGRIHILRQDWDRVISGYRDAGLFLTIHGPLTPEFSLSAAAEDAEALIRRYHPVLDAAADVASDQGGTVLILHGAANPDLDEARNEALSRSTILKRESQAGDRTPHGKGDAPDCCSDISRVCVANRRRRARNERRDLLGCCARCRKLTCSRSTVGVS
jgi:hypothetical protein